MLVLAQNVSFTTFNLNGFSDLGKWRPILSIPYFLMFSLSTISNSFLIYLVKSQQTLHSPMFILIALMAVVDLSLPICFVPNMLFSLIFNWNGISFLGCLIQMFFIHLLGTFQSTVLLWMAVDRFFAICRPLYYHKHMGMPNFVKFIIYPVIRNIVLVSMMVTLAGKLSFCITNNIDHCFCEHMAVVQLACGNISFNNIFGLSIVFSTISADFIFITGSYIVILISVLKSGKANLKAFNTCITHIIVMAFTLSFGLIAFLAYRISNSFSPSSRVFLSTMYILFPSCLNPIIYGVRTKEIREQFLNFLKCLRS